MKNLSKINFLLKQIPLGLVEMLIKSCTKENDDVFILFGGSGSEIVLCQELKRNFISCELHPKYYKMIQDRLANNGKISEEYRLRFVQEKKKVSTVEVSPTLFDLETPKEVIQNWIGVK